MLVACLTPAGCYRAVTDGTAATGGRRYTGAAPWTIDGVRPGDEFAAVKMRFGEPREVRGSGNQRTAFWERRATVVTFDGRGVVTEVMGSTVQADGKILVESGATEADVIQILGPGRVQKTHQPGSGVISISRTHVGTAVIYERDGVRFELPVFGDAAGNFLARRLP